MEEEISSLKKIPEQLRSLIDFLWEFPEAQNVGPEFWTRREFWKDTHKRLREEVERGNLTWEQYDSLQGSLVAAKEWLSDRDFLTGLGNRRAYEQRLQERLSESKRYGTPLTLMALAIDNLKPLNDERGHAVGDLFLTKLGEIIQKNKRREDFAARIGGDEISILLPYTSTEQAEFLIGRLQEKIRRLVEETSEFANLSKPLGVSFGKAQWDGKENSEEWQKRADDALYRAKNQRKNG